MRELCTAAACEAVRWSSRWPVLSSCSITLCVNARSIHCLVPDTQPSKLVTRSISQTPGQTRMYMI